MKVDFNIDVHHVTRIEGHGNIKVKVKDGKLIDCQWEIIETPRFFEALLKGKKYDVAAPLTSRICGICSVGHSLASIRATERALKVPVTPQTQKLRQLLMHGENIQSHALHVFFLVAPDLVNENSVIPLIQSNPDLVVIAAMLKKLGNDICTLVGGRQTHPQSCVPGGFLKVPRKSELQVIKNRIFRAIADLKKSAEVLKTLPLPDFVRETEFISLKGVKEYPFIGGDLVSTDGVQKAEDDYRAMTNEYTTKQSTAKWTKLSRKSFAVGALARLNNNYEFLSPLARQYAEEFKLRPVCHNPFMNNIAQFVECFHSCEDSVRLIDELLESDLKPEKVDVKVQAGHGVGAVEVPRGILFHDYEYDKTGRIVKANCIIPTNMNHANIQHDLEELVKKLSDEGVYSSRIEKLSEMLVRSYDPCVSCSVH